MVKSLNDEGKNLIKGIIENNRILKLIIIEKEVKIMEEVREKIVEVRRFFDLNNIFYVMIICGNVNLIKLFLCYD